MKLPLRDILHLALIIPASAGVAVGLFLLSQACENDLTEDSFFATASSAWAGIFSRIPANMPGHYASPEEGEGDEEPSSVEDLSSRERNEYAQNNAFLVTCSLLVLAGCFGLGFLGAGKTLGEPIWNPILRTGAISAVALIAFLLWGFGLAFPSEQFGILPILSFHFPGQIDVVDYGLQGISEWTDLLYIGTYAALVGAILFSFCNARQTAASIFLIAIPVATISFPIGVSWLWGTGWLDAAGVSFDFAGASLLHWHVGSVALVIGGIAMLFRKALPKNSTSSTEKGWPRMPWLAVGGIGYFLAMIGLNTGSTLESTPALVASVLQSCFLASAASGILALAWWSLFRNRTALEFAIFGVVAGCVSVSGATDSLTLAQSIGFGVATGILVPGAIVWMDRIGWSDPLAAGPIHGIGGAIATLGTSLVSLGEDYVVTLGGQLLMLATIPLGSLFLAAIVVVVLGVTNFLFTDTTDQGPTPPPLPRSS